MLVLEEHVPASERAVRLHQRVKKPACASREGVGLMHPSFWNPLLQESPPWPSPLLEVPSQYHHRGNRFQHKFRRAVGLGSTHGSQQGEVQGAWRYPECGCWMRWGAHLGSGQAWPHMAP